MLSIGGITYTDAWDAGARPPTAPSSARTRPRSPAARRRHRDRLRAEQRSRTSTGLQAFIDAYRAIQPYDASGADPAAPPDDRPRGRRPLADRHRAQGDGRLAAHRHPGARLRQRDGPGAPAEHGIGRSANWQEHVDGKAAVQPGVPAAGAGEVHRRPVHRRGLQGPCRVHQLRGLGPEVDGAVRPDGRAQRRRDHARACSATCSGRPSGHRPGASGPRRRTPARAGSAAGRRSTTSRSRCRRCARADRGRSAASRPLSAAVARRRPARACDAHIDEHGSGMALRRPSGLV